MNADRDPRTGQTPLPGFAESAPAEGRVPLPGSSEADPADRAAQTRTEGIRRVRRMSNWTAAALIVGAGATTLALAHNAVPVSVPMVGSASTTTAIGTAAVAHGTSGPQVAHSVATTSASGVTTTTANGNGATAVAHGTSGPQVAHSVATTSASGVTTTTTTQVVNGKTVVTHTQNIPAYHDD